MKKVIGAIIIFSCSLGAMDSDSKAEDQAAGDEASIQVNKIFIAQLREQRFEEFMATKKGQHGTLKTVTGLPLIGRMASGILEQFGFVENTNHALTFLDRIFESEPQFKATVDQLEEDNANITYLQAVFAQLDNSSVSREELVAAMRAERHQHVPDPDKMGEKNDDGYVLADEHFHPWAACNLLVFHWHEQQQQQEQQPRRLRRRSSSGGDKKSKKKG